MLGSYAGFRPLLDAPGRTEDLSRHHLVRVAADGLVTVTGGKLTTYRAMAQDAVDRITDRPSRTKRLPRLLRPVADGIGVLGVELLWGVHHEGALTVEDLLARRTRVALVPADAARVRPYAESVLAAVLPRKQR